MFFASIFFIIGTYSCEFLKEIVKGFEEKMIENDKKKSTVVPRNLTYLQLLSEILRIYLISDIRMTKELLKYIYKN